MNFQPKHDSDKTKLTQSVRNRTDYSYACIICHRAAKWIMSIDAMNKLKETVQGQGIHRKDRAKKCLEDSLMHERKQVYNMFGTPKKKRSQVLMRWADRCYSESRAKALHGGKGRCVCVGGDYHGTNN